MAFHFNKNKDSAEVSTLAENNSLSPQQIRTGLDRRKNFILAFVYAIFKRRRKTIRRSADHTKNQYVDFHEPGIFIIFSLIIVLCVADSIFTLIIINNGGQELNPVMDYLMVQDVMLFFWAKFLVTSFGLLFLVCHKYFIFFKRISGYHIIYSVLLAYIILINYELVLLNEIFNVI